MIGEHAAAFWAAGAEAEGFVIGDAGQSVADSEPVGCRRTRFGIIESSNDIPEGLRASGRNARGAACKPMRMQAMVEETIRTDPRPLEFAQTTMVGRQTRAPTQPVIAGFGE
jgi:hypothetical protein